MSDVSAQGSGAQKTDPSAGPAQTGDEGQAQNQNQLTPEAVKAMIEESNRPLHAEIRRLREASKPKSQSQSEEERTLSQRIKDLESRERDIADERKVNSIRSAAVKAGVPEDRVDVFVDHVLAQRGSQIIADKSGAVWDQYNDAESRKPISALIDEVLKARGEVFKPAAPLPQARGLRANGRVQSPVRRYDDIPQHERLKMSPAERLRLAQDSFNQ